MVAFGFPYYYPLTCKFVKVLLPLPVFNLFSTTLLKIWLSYLNIVPPFPLLTYLSISSEQMMIPN